MNYALPFKPALLPDFSEFVVFDGFLPHEVERIRDLWDARASKQVTLTGEQTYDERLRDSAVIFLEPSATTQWIYDRIAALAASCNAETYRFDLNGFLQPLQLTEYQSGQFFDWHMDFGRGEISHRKLSVTVQLSDESSSEGGDLHFRFNQHTRTAPRRKGSVIVFPSFVQHRIAKVISGKRHSIVGWLSGPPYR